MGDKKTTTRTPAKKKVKVLIKKPFIFKDTEYTTGNHIVSEKVAVQMEQLNYGTRR